MEMTFEFNQQLMPQSLVEIGEIGQFGLEAWNDEGYYWYLVVSTQMGKTIMASCGPVIPDVDIMPSGFSMSYTEVDYKEDKLCKTINFYLNDKGKKLTNAQVIPIKEAISQFKDLQSYLDTHIGEIPDDKN